MQQLLPCANTCPLPAGIDFITGTRVTGVDVASKTLTTAAGDTISYGKLVVATGARPTTLADFKTPGHDLQVCCEPGLCQGRGNNP